MTDGLAKTTNLTTEPQRHRDKELNTLLFFSVISVPGENGFFAIASMTLQ